MSRTRGASRVILTTVVVVVVVMIVVVAFCADEVDAIASLANRWKPEKVNRKTKSKSLCQVSLVYLVSIFFI